MNTRAWLGAFLAGLPGIREIALVALVVAVLYGRSGLQVVRRGGGLPWWLSPLRRTAPSGARGRPRMQARAQAQAQAPAAGAARSPVSLSGDRLFWFLAILAATAVGAWVVTRTLIVGAPKLSQ